MEGFWQHCLDQFKNELTIQQFNTWIKPLRIVPTGDCVCLLAPNRFVLQWVREKFLARIEALAELQFGRPTAIQLKLEEHQKQGLSLPPVSGEATIPSKPFLAAAKPAKNEQSG